MTTALNYYRRHGLNCEGGRAPESHTSEFDERKKGWKRCTCSIHVNGTLGRKFRRMGTKAIDWKAAAAVMEPFILADSWDAARASAPAAAAEQTESETDSEPSPENGTVEEACLVWLAAKGGRDLAPATLKKYRTFTKQLTAFALKRGVNRLADFKVADLDIFTASWNDGPNSKGKKLERMRGFFDFFIARDWLIKNPATPIEPPVNYAKHKQKTPFTDDELDRIFRAAAAWKTCNWHNRGVSGQITADEVVTFAMLLTETGLRISDAATFNVSDRINPENHECFLRMHKTGKPLYIWINPELYDRLLALTQRLGASPFIVQSLDKERAADAWRERLTKVFETAGTFEEKPTPHLFRHTFVRLQLQRGVSVDDVAELIGDTPEMVRRHYARWVPERQLRLTTIMQAAYKESLKKKWRGHVVPITRVKQG